MACVFVIFHVIRHILPQRHIVLKLARFTALIILRLDVASLLFFLKVGVVFFRFIARVGGHVSVCLTELFLHEVKQRDQCQLIAALTRHIKSRYVFTLYRKLYIVAWLELCVAHVIFLHVHKGGVRISL